MTHSNKNLSAIISYFFWIGWFLAIIFYQFEKNELNKFHIKQALTLHFFTSIILSLDLIIELEFKHWDFIVWISLILILFWFLEGLIFALKSEKKEIWLIGKIQKLWNKKTLTN